jgi:hypothetical protein
LPPVEFCRGTNPIQAANSRPVLKALGSVMVAATALDTITPKPGIASSLRLAGLARWA